MNRSILPCSSQHGMKTRKPKQQYVFRSIWLVATCFLTQAYAQTLAGPIDVPKSDVLLLKAQGKGAQIYGCVQGNWMLIGPDAKLLDEQSNVIGRHYIGPTWQLKDGSLVTGKAIANKPLRMLSLCRGSFLKHLPAPASSKP